MADKSKTPSSVKHVPKDAQVVLSIMKDMGITDYEPKVINQLLEFTYRYVSCILDDSKMYANHSKKKVIDMDDVRLAVQMQLESSFTNPPPRDVLLEVAKAKNSVPLPFVKPSYGLRLPPDRYCLNGTNYKLKPPPKKSGRGGKLGATGAFDRMNSPGYSIIKRPGALTTISRNQTVSMPKPIMKVTTPANTSLMRPQPQKKQNIQLTSDVGQIQLPTIKTEMKIEPDESNKRKREDDDYDVP